MNETLKIVSVPQGPQPRWVRQAMVGQEVQFDLQIDQDLENIKAFPISRQELAVKLQKRHPKAANWLRHNSSDNLAIKKGSCEIIPQAEF